jgi:tryptophanyl-tRNA synthetase
VACKNNLAKKLATYLEPFREKRKYYEQHIDEVHDIIAHGNSVAQQVASETMAEVHKVMKLG